jgi:mannose-6-phosphate isomerase-like protein (cupin superfamily)
MGDGVGQTALQTGAVPDRFVSLRRQLGVSSFGINQLVLEPGQRMRIHRHRDQEEVYLVTEGTLDMKVDGEDLIVHAGGLVRVAPGERRQVINRGPGRLSLVIVGGAGEHQSRDAEAFAAWEDDTPGEPRDIPLPDDLGDADLRG